MTIPSVYEPTPELIKELDECIDLTGCLFLTYKVKKGRNDERKTINLLDKDVVKGFFTMNGKAAIILAQKNKWGQNVRIEMHGQEYLLLRRIVNYLSLNPDLD